MTASQNLIGCEFDAMTAQALAGKKIVALVTDDSGSDLLCIAGQQGLSFNMSAETSESATKDSSSKGWSIKFHGSKSWDASIDGLWSVSDEGTKRVARALANDEFLCLKICERTIATDGTITYVPIRMGIAIVSSDNFEAPHDDNATFSMEFQGSGAPWMRETATAQEISAATITVVPVGVMGASPSSLVLGKGESGAVEVINATGAVTASVSPSATGNVECSVSNDIAVISTGDDCEAGIYVVTFTDSAVPAKTTNVTVTVSQ